MDGFPYPIIEDESRELATKLGMLDPAEVDQKGIPLAARAVFVIDPKKKMRLSILYPATSGRNFEYVFEKCLSHYAASIIIGLRKIITIYHFLFFFSVKY